MNRSLASALLFAGLALPGCTSRAPAPPGDPVAPIAIPPSPTAISSAPHQSENVPPEARAAFETLRTADRFDSTHIGFAGLLSPYVAAFRIVLAQPTAASLFSALYAKATMEGKLYALSGLYLTDPEPFAVGVASLERDHAEVNTMTGCITGRRSVAEVVRFPAKDRMKIPKGQTLDQAAASGAGPGDVAGGVTPLSFLEVARPAPRDPL